jgi:hypothetical protein
LQAVGRDLTDVAFSVECKSGDAQSILQGTGRLSAGSQ